ncbi:uncharacterized protein CANTADRAFT_49155 [Suhomyces tanzawaensis NRRL Y-17324]|uniref:Acyl-CoA desaturase n=1 Tax=Suhomyces tanzawaensis NRRL Y-17324 TaxID=984487 RepID=A0A1E4SKZ5_9ASCO|nr:uncharacterized protein CANTADRAFT_49155 [Suhomyces tanzawaensis NRRL Y-17324]ODV80181.1 hypothetical protein CANTADRAFT_49155 [Suhomyces tanzawaensis NRRL Y-17324]
MAQQSPPPLGVRVSPPRIAGTTHKVQRRKVKNDTTSSQIINHASHLKNTHMNEMRKRKRDFFNRINYGYALTVAVIPALAVLYLLQGKEPIIPSKTSTLYFTIAYFHFTLLSFTSGYHRYFAHNSFKARCSFVQYYFAIFGSSIGLGSIRWWASLHRAHHHFTDDTERDPYLIKRGFIWAHWGWLIKKPKIVTFYTEFMEQEFPKKTEAPVNEALDNDLVYTQGNMTRNDYDENIQRLLVWQEKYYYPLHFLTTWVIPIAVTMMLGDSFAHGLLYPGVLRMFACQQALLSTESVCHLKSIHVSIPSQPFNDKNSSQNCHNPLVTLLTYGQGYQNYHHEFPHDYRSTASPLAFDPTKWFIWTLDKLGVVEELCRTPADLITQLRIQQQQQVINRMKSQLNWGTPISKLPKITPTDFKRIIASSSNKDRIYIVIQNIIHDITPFMDQHPGGVPLLKASHGKDATKAFYGGVYGHLTAAVNLLATMRIGVLDVGNEEEVWRRVVREEGDVDGSSGRQMQLYRTAEAA